MMLTRACFDDDFGCARVRDLFRVNVINVNGRVSVYTLPGAMSICMKASEMPGDVHVRLVSASTFVIF